jgi:hypothetical protein
LISTDRPGFLFSSSLVPDGTVQLEAGTPVVSLDEESGDETTFVSLPVQLRWGLSPSLELRFGSPVYNWLRADPGEDDEGFGDVELGAKTPLPLPFGQDASALIAGVLLPAGDDAFQVDGPAPAVNAVASWALGDVYSLTGLAGLAYLPNDGGADPIVGSLAAYLSRSLGAGWTGSFEADWFPAEHADERAFAGVWATKLLSDTVQLDVSVFRGLTDAASDWLVGIGLSFRY